MRYNPQLAVVDLTKIPGEMARDLRTIWFVYGGVLTSEVLYHLAHCAREAEAQDAAKLAEMLGMPTIEVLSRGRS